MQEICRACCRSGGATVPARVGRGCRRRCACHCAGSIQPVHAGM